MRIGQTNYSEARDNIHSLVDEAGFVVPLDDFSRDLLWVDSLHAEGIQWSADSSQFWLAAYTDDAPANTLRVIRLRWRDIREPGAIPVSFSASDILTSFGSPDTALALIDLREDASIVGIGTILIYSEGLVFQFYQDAPVSRTEEDGQSRIHAQFCPGDNRSQIDGGWLTGWIYILDPISANPDEWTPFQNRVFGELVKSRGYQPLEEVFGINGRELYQLLLGDPDSCIESLPLF